jgi:hypothetical protein
MATSAHSWTCPSCGRRVPLRVDRCHCGASRAQVEQAAAAAVASARPGRGGRRPAWRDFADELGRTMPVDVKRLLALAILMLVVGLGWLFLGPRHPDTTPRILGFVDAGPPPVPHPTPTPRPPFKLPWWK